MKLLTKVQTLYIIAGADSVGGVYASVIDDGEGFLVVKNYQHKNLFHGSAKRVSKFQVHLGSGRFGKGLYLTPSADTAEFYSKGGRQGEAGQSLKEKGHVYTFELHAPVAVIVTDEHKFSSYMVSEDEEAEEAFRGIGEYESARVTKHWSRFVQERYGADALVYTEEGGVLTPFPQIVVLDEKAIKQQVT